MCKCMACFRGVLVKHTYSVFYREYLFSTTDCSDKRYSYFTSEEKCMRLRSSGQNPNRGRQISTPCMQDREERLYRKVRALLHSLPLNVRKTMTFFLHHSYDILKVFIKLQNFSSPKNGFLPPLCVVPALAGSPASFSTILHVITQRQGLSLNWEPSVSAGLAD